MTARARQRGSILFPIVELQINVIVISVLMAIALPLVLPLLHARNAEVRCGMNIVRIADGAAPASLECPETGKKYEAARCAGPGPGPGRTDLAQPPATVEAPGPRGHWIGIGVVLLLTIGISVDSASPARQSRGWLIFLSAFVLAALAYGAWMGRTTRLERVRARVTTAKGQVYAIYEDGGDLRVRRVGSKPE